jgi:HD-like signal output (HDOD) protein
MTSAFGASWCAMERALPPDGAFLAGMFHDVGKSMALRSLADLLVRGRIRRPSDAVVDTVLERLHLKLGAATASAWGLPPDIVTVCAMHHEHALPARTPPAVHVVRVVSGLNRIRVDPSEIYRREAEVLGSAAALGIEEAWLPRLADRLADFAVWVTEVLEIPDAGR